jgi:predicted transcriptional regulator
MTKDELIAEIAAGYQALEALDKGKAAPVAEQTVETTGPAVSKSIWRSQGLCMICGKALTTLKLHLATSHDLKPGEDRQQVGIPSSQPLAAKDYSERRKQMAIGRNLEAGVARAHTARGHTNQTFS